MAEHNFNDSGAAVATAQNGINAAGTHFTSQEGAETDVTRALIPGLIKTVFDNQVVKMGWATTPINAMTREMGYKPLKAMEYGYFSVDLRKVEDAVSGNATTISNAVGSEGQSGYVPAVVGYKINSYTANAEETIKVADSDKFDVTDVIVFEGIDGKTAGVNLAARVSGKGNNAGELKIQFLNAPSTGVSIPNATKIYILGHAAAEIDASTTPYAALPSKQTQYMQKFMVQSLISSVMLESEKEAQWGKSDINELLMQQFVEDVEKTYIWGVKSYTFDAHTHLYTRTTSGIVEQMIEGGSPVIEIPEDTFDKEDLLDAMSTIFVGNSGSSKRYMFTGIDFAKKMFSLDGVEEWVNVNDTVRKFEYDFTQIKLFNYVLLNAPHPLFDKCGWRKNALVIDRQYLERRVFRSMDETALELKKTGAYDGESSVWSEISSVVLKYPKCHALIKLV